MNVEIKPLNWIGSSYDDLLAMPTHVRQVFGQALRAAQQGEKHHKAKPLKGFSGAGVLEIVQDYEGDAYRAVYTVKFKDAVYALHVFRKKSKRGIKTPRHEIELVRERLDWAEEDYREWKRAGGA